MMTDRTSLARTLRAAGDHAEQVQAMEWEGGRATESALTTELRPPQKEGPSSAPSTSALRLRASTPSAWATPSPLDVPGAVADARRHVLDVSGIEGVSAGGGSGAVARSEEAAPDPRRLMSLDPRYQSAFPVRVASWLC
jgi:hypothetical protein